MNIVTLNSTTMMSTKEVAELTDKRHGDVIRDANNMFATIDDANLRHEDFQVVKDYRGYTAEILLNKNLTVCLVAGYDANVRFKIIKRWQELENQQPQPQFNLPATYLDALKCLVAETEAHNETKAVVKQATHHLTTAVNILEQALPKANAFDTAIGSGEHMLISEAAKFIGVGQVALFGWLESNGWIFRRGNNSKWQAYAGKISGGLMAHRFTDGFDARGGKHTACTALITPRGALVIKALMQ